MASAQTIASGVQDDTGSDDGIRANLIIEQCTADVNHLQPQSHLFCLKLKIRRLRKLACVAE